MKGKRKRIATRDRTALAAYLGRNGRPEGSLTLPEVYRFFFAVACGPTPSAAPSGSSCCSDWVRARPFATSSARICSWARGAAATPSLTTPVGPGSPCRYYAPTAPPEPAAPPLSRSERRRYPSRSLRAAGHGTRSSALAQRTDEHPRAEIIGQRHHRKGRIR
jgi:hypothetical protein